MFLPLILIQMFLIRTGWWVYYSYITQPKYNHPMIFWNPLMRMALVVGPSTCAILLVVFSFYQNIHPWWFLLFSFGWWMYGSKLHKPNDESLDVARFIHMGLWCAKWLAIWVVAILFINSLIGKNDNSDEGISRRGYYSDY